jgi:hypothetical protein
MVNLQWHSLNPNYKASKLRTYKSKPSRWLIISSNLLQIMNKKG